MAGKDAIVAEPILPLVYLVSFAFLLGGIIGSFLNVVIHRVPRGESIVRPGSHCPGCGNAIRPFDNIPLVSFLLLRGRCRSCGERISWRYPLVELLTAVLFAAIIGKSGVTIDAVCEMIFAAAMVALIFIDAREQILPNVITYPLFLLVLLGSAWRAGWGEPIAYAFDFSILFSMPETGFPVMRAAIVGGILIALAAPGFWLMDRIDLLLFNKYFDWEETPEEEGALSIYASAEEIERQHDRTIYITMMLGVLCGIGWGWLVWQRGAADSLAYAEAYAGLRGAVAGALVGSIPLWWLRAVYFYLRGIEGMGLGDIKLMAIIGAFLGWQGALGTLLLASIVGSVAGLILMRRSGQRLKTAIPFGCFLGMAALVVLFKQFL